MNTVEPIRDINTVWDIADYLGEKSERNKIMFLFGIYVGIRVSDILSLKVRDVRDMNYVSIREMKTGKEKRFPINEELRPLLNRYIKGKADYEPLFPSRQQNRPSWTGSLASMPQTSTSIRTMTTASLSMRGKPTMRR